jgi:hypothetical protein
MNLWRRQLALAALAAAATPIDTWAQPAPGVHRIGLFTGGSSPKAKENTGWLTFFDSMRQLGYEEGRNVVYEMRYSEGVPERFPQLASELVAAGVGLIVVLRGRVPPAVRARAGVRRQNSQGRKAGRDPDRAADALWPLVEPEHGAHARHQVSAHDHAARRAGDRVIGAVRSGPRLAPG